MTTSAAYIRPGKLRCYATLQQPVTVEDAGGGLAVTWTTEKNLWCAIREQSAKETVAAMQEQSSVTHEIWTRYDSDITAQKRITYGGRTFNIRAILNPMARNEFMRLLCESGVAT